MATRKRRNLQPLLGTFAINLAREALVDLGEGEVGEHIGVVPSGHNVLTHRFAATVPGYDGWEWNAVVACAEGSQWVTVNEVALVPGGSALQAPQWVPYYERVRPGDLGPGDVLPPREDDERLTTDPALAADNSAAERPEGTKLLSRAGLEATRARWRGGEFGPDSPFAKKAAMTCATCSFYLPLAAPVGEGFGACANEYSADGQVVSAAYGCGAHSATPPEPRLGAPVASAVDDEAPIDVALTP